MKKHVFYFNLLKMQAMKGMKIWLVMVVMVFAVGVQGQGWMKTYGGMGDQGTIVNNYRERAIARTLDGGIMAVSDNFNDPLSNDSALYLVKVDDKGIILFEKHIQIIGGNLSPADIEPSPDGGFFIAGDSPYDTSGAFILKINEAGDLQWFKTIDVGESKILATAIEVDTEGNILFTGFNIASKNCYLAKLNSTGVLTWWKSFNASIGFGTGPISRDLIISGNEYIICGFTFGSNSPSSTKAFILKTNGDGELDYLKIYEDDTKRLGSYALVASNNGGVISAGFINDGVRKPYIFKVDSNGNKIWEKVIENIIHEGAFYDIITSGNGIYHLVGFNASQSDSNVLMTEIDDQGNLLWSKNFGTLQDEGGTSIIQLNDGNIVIGGGANRANYGKEVLLIKTDSLGILFSSALTGTLHQDPESDCLPDPTEPGLSGWLVQATGAQSFATLTDSLGHFILPVDTGSYEVTVAPPSPYWEICNSPTTASITAFYDTLSLDFPAQAITDCPYLTVDISAPFLRRCFDNNYYVHYCNDGTASANDATVEVTLDPYFTYVSSTLPLASQNGNTLSFDLGDVAVGDCGNFQITAYLDCDSTVLGQTHCTTAHITPDSLCLPPDPLWDGSSIETDASCDGDSVHFTITNVGAEDMPSPLGYIIIEDEIVLLTNDFQLGAGQSIIVTLPANGSTFHLEAQQAAAHPSGFASTGATIEGCGSWLSLGFFTQWAFDDDPDPFTDVDCQANVGSFDPNDKQGFPAGLAAAPTEIGVIEPGQDIEYLIRFQNTGTDTAFKVTVVDVLPPELDLATVRPGASSHPYTYGVTPEGWLTFTFDDIQLPDSTTNEAASHGFVRFRASQRPGLGWGNVIANTALIYFDFNAPVQTNTFKHRIGQVFPWSEVGTTPPVFQPKTNVKIVPNPLTDSALLQVEGIEPGPLNLVLTDVSGKILRQQTVNGTGFEFQRGELNPGLYFFKIERNGERVGSGKLMVK